LQGQMGAYYARAEGIDPVVCDAIEQHYKPVGADDTPPSSALGALVGVCERIDALVGCFGVGLVPKGNRDPFALRRAALSLLRIAESGPIDVDVAALFALAYDGFGDEAKMAPKGEVLGALDDFMRARLLAHYRESFRTDIVQAAMGAWAGGSLRDLHARITAVEALRGTDAFEALATAFKRAFNITKDAKFAEAVQEDLLEDGAERKLWDAFCSARGQLDARAGDHEASLRIVAEQLRTPIDAFFDEVFVMADDERVRTNRLTMLGAIADAVSRTVHFHRIAGDA
ncbi:MAG: glycine--tRNA ligase subunit beta, partial [Myxococcota bacterium]